MDQLDAGIPKEILIDRVDVSVPVLDKHYDHRTEARKSQRRREELEALMLSTQSQTAAKANMNWRRY